MDKIQYEKAIDFLSNSNLDSFPAEILKNAISLTLPMGEVFTLDTLFEELHLDELDRIDVATELEEALGIKIEEDLIYIDDFSSVRELQDKIVDKILEIIV